MALRSAGMLCFFVPDLEVSLRGGWIRLRVISVRQAEGPELCMIHFFAHNMRPGVRTPLHDELDKIGEPYAVISDAIDKSYRYRWQLLFRVLPAIARFAVRASWQSLRSRSCPEAVVLGSDFEVLSYALLKRLLRKPDVKIILTGFIYTSRSAKALTMLRHTYFRLILSCAARIICHSHVEVIQYGLAFPSLKDRFVFVFWGCNVNSRERYLHRGGALGEGERPYVLAAGRSGRDYACLFAAWRHADLPLHVVCDLMDALPRQQLPDSTQVLTACHGGDYMREVVHSKFVVVPLQYSEISSGQMVLIQAMALGRACIITETPTTIEYVEHMRNGILVKPDDPDALASAVRQLARDPVLRARLEAAALQTFESRHAFGVYVASLVNVARSATKIQEVSC